MEAIPFLQFWGRQKDTIAELGAQLSAMMGTEHKGLRIFISLLHANAPVIKRYLPELNKNGLLDDFIATLDKAAYTTLTEGVPDDDG